MATLNESMLDEIVKELAVELKNDEDFDEEVLAVKVRGAYREVKAARKYPGGYTDAMIESDMERYYSAIRKVALYDYNQIGIEGQVTSSENGISRGYVDRDSLFSGVIPIGTVG